MKFNIFYLNFSKVYETKMLINNLVSQTITKEQSHYSNSNNEIGFSNDVFSLKYGNNEGEYYKLTETLKVKEEKSVILNKILEHCNTVKKLEDLQEGDLILINDVNIEFFDDEETERMLSLLPKEALSGMVYEGFDVSNFILKYFNDSAYHLKCEFDKKELVFKIPMENSTEFESKYSINDLLIGKLSIVGIYKGEISEKDFKRSNFLTALEQNNSQHPKDYNNKIISSNEKNHSEDVKDKFDKNELKYLDIFAIIQKINFKEEITDENKSFLKRTFDKIKNLVRREL